MATDISDSEYEDNDEWLQPNTQPTNNAVSAHEIEKTQVSGHKRKRKRKQTVYRMTKLDKQRTTFAHHQNLFILLIKLKDWNDFCNDVELKAVLLSILPSRLYLATDASTICVQYVERLVGWFSFYFQLDHMLQFTPNCRSMKDCALRQLHRCIAMRGGNESHLSLLFIALARALCIPTRLVSPLDVLSLKTVLPVESEHFSTRSNLSCSGDHTDNVIDIRSDNVIDIRSDNVIDIRSDNVIDIRSDNVIDIRSDNLCINQPSVIDLSQHLSENTYTTQHNNEIARKKNTTNRKHKAKSTSATKSGQHDLKTSTPLSTRTLRSRSRAQRSEQDVGLTGAQNTSISFSDLSSASSDCYSTRRPKRRKSTPQTKKSTPQTKNIQSASVWCELYLSEEKRWISVDCVYRHIDNNDIFHQNKGRNMNYVVSVYSRCQSSYVDEQTTTSGLCQSIGASVVKDVTAKYVPKWSAGSKFRTNPDSWQDMLRCVNDTWVNDKYASIDDYEIEERKRSEGFPTSLAAYKNHPLYCIEKHCLRYQVIYPKTPVLGTIKTQPIYPIANLQDLHTKDRWFREARQVTDDQLDSPAKVVKTSKLAIRTADSEFTNLYGKWQTVQWTPEEARDGCVPKNERGNVDLWSPEHLPPGTVHISLPRVASVAKKLKIDYAPAMVGFDIKKGKSVPIIDGVVVCVEQEDSIRDACIAMEERRQEKERKKQLLRVLTTWRIIVRGVALRYRLKLQTDSDELSTTNLFANTDNHTHCFDPSSFEHNKEQDVWTKTCECGFSVQFEHF